MKRVGTKNGDVADRLENGERSNQGRQPSGDNLPCQTEMTSACRGLENAVRVGGRTIMVTGRRMLMTPVVLMRLGKLIEKVMDLVRRGIS